MKWAYTRLHLCYKHHGAYSFHASATTLDDESIAFGVEHARHRLSRTPPNHPVLATTA